MEMLDSIIKNPLAGARIISYGEIIFDQIAGKSYLGGAPLNFAWYVNQMGAEVSLVSSLGRDVSGDQALNAILGSGIDPMLSRNDQATGSASLEQDGTFNIHRGAAWEEIPAPHIYGIDFRMLYFGTLSQVSEANRTAIRKLLNMRPKYVVVDLNLRKDGYSPETIENCLEQASIVKMNSEEWKVVASVTGISHPETLMSRKQLNALAITSGPAGATLYSAAGAIEFKPDTVKDIDPTGAGDAFTAVLSVGIITNAHPAQALAAACQAGAIVVSQKGAMVELPNDIKSAYDDLENNTVG